MREMVDAIVEIAAPLHAGMRPRIMSCGVIVNCGDVVML